MLPLNNMEFVVLAFASIFSGAAVGAYQCRQNLDFIVTTGIAGLFLVLALSIRIFTQKERYLKELANELLRPEEPRSLAPTLIDPLGHKKSGEPLP